jgi:hypothetical protein
MLDSDLCMVYGHNSGTLSASTANCCAWVTPQSVFNAGAVENGENYCGRTYDDAVGRLDRRRSTGLCCGKQGSQRPSADCDNIDRPVGPAYNDVVDFAANEDEWLEAYVAAWKMAQENGWTTLSALATTEDASTDNTTTEERQRQGGNTNTKQQGRKGGNSRGGRGGSRGGRR